MARGRKKRGGGIPVLGIGAVITAVIFMPTTILLMIGMLPTVVAAVIDRSGKGTKAITVGAMNIAGCTLYLLQLWTMGHTKENALMLISDPRNVITIYCAAGVGYMIDWMMAGIVTTIVIGKSKHRLEEIVRKQGELAARWGPEVTGDLPLDEYGFTIDASPVQGDKTLPAQQVGGKK